jgi:hypothetical protein
MNYLNPNGGRAIQHLKALEKKLLSEDADENFSQCGNFTKTYSHVGLVNAVYRLSTKLDKPIFL